MCFILTGNKLVLKTGPRSMFFYSYVHYLFFFFSWNFILSASSMCNFHWRHYYFNKTVIMRYILCVFFSWIFLRSFNLHTKCFLFLFVILKHQNHYTSARARVCVSLCMYFLLQLRTLFVVNFFMSWSMSTKNCQTLSL